MVEPTISFRLSKEAMETLNQIKGEKSDGAYCKEIIETYLKTGVNETLDFTDVTIKQQQFNEEIKHKQELLDMAQQRISDLQTHNGFLISQIQQLNQQLNRLLLPEPQQQTKKQWFEFWKR